MIILVEITVSIVTLHVGVKIFILSQDSNLASGRELLDIPERFYLTLYLKPAYKRAASLEAFKQLLMKHDFA